MLTTTETKHLCLGPPVGQNSSLHQITLNTQITLVLKQHVLLASYDLLWVFSTYLFSF